MESRYFHKPVQKLVKMLPMPSKNLDKSYFKKIES